LSKGSLFPGHSVERLSVENAVFAKGNKMLIVQWEKSESIGPVRVHAGA